MNIAAETIANNPRPVNLTPEQIKNFLAKVDKNQIGQGCWIWLRGKTKYGYGAFCMNGGSLRTHRIAWTLANGAIPNGLNILHKCNNACCCNPKHLVPGNQKENCADRENGGRGNHPNGEKHGRAKLDPKKISEIRLRYAAGGITQREIGAEFGVCKASVYYIVKQKTWNRI